MPGITIGHLLAASQTTPYLPFDDTFLTGLCTAKVGIKVRISERLLKQFKSYSQHYLTINKVIHNIHKDFLSEELQKCQNPVMCIPLLRG
jgi:hypothetical protein